MQQIQRQGRELFVLRQDTEMRNRREDTVKEALLDLQRGYERNGYGIRFLYGITLPVPYAPTRVFTPAFVVDGVKVDGQKVVINCNPRQEITGMMSLRIIQGVQRAYGMRVWYFPQVPIQDIAHALKVQPQEIANVVGRGLGSPVGGTFALGRRIDNMLSGGTLSASNTFEELRTTARFIERRSGRSATPEGENGEVRWLRGPVPGDFI